MEMADKMWENLEKEDYLEAFSHHPKIGADPDELRRKFKRTHEQSAAEQSGVKSASDETLEELAKQNQIYLDRFGYIFIVCASGKSATEMLEILKGRVNNPEDIELKIAAAEQAKITKIRLEKLIS